MISTLFLYVLGAFAFISVLSFLVFFHELGHYSVGRFFGIAVDRFSIGFGKPIWQRRAKSGTLWTISRIPLGGFVKFSGDAGAASNPDHDKLAQIKAEMEAEHGEGAADQCFHFKPLWQRALVVLAGPMANFLLALIIYSIFSMSVGIRDYQAVVGGLTPDFPAEQAGFMAGDEILTLNGKDASTVNKITAIVRLNAGEVLETQLLRAGQTMTLNVTPIRVVEDDFIGGEANYGKIGMGWKQDESLLIFEKYSPLASLEFGVSEIGRNISMTGQYVGRIFSGKEDGKALGGPTKIAAMTSKMAIDAANATHLTGWERLKGGFLNLVMLSAVLSIGLGVANLMPIPVLDGGHLVYYGYEAIAGRPLSERSQEIGFRIGLSMLLGLFVILTWNDIGYVRSLF